MNAIPMQPARLNKAGVVDTYTRLAPLYDLWARLTETRARHRAVELAAVRDGERVLEVAVGTGLTFADLLRANPRGHTEGLDLTPAMLARARKRAESTPGAGDWHLAPGDAYALAFGDETFDAVHNAYMFDMLPEADFGRVLGEMFRVLKPGGRLVLVNMGQGRRFWHRLPETIYRLRPQWMGGCRGVTLREAVGGAGFELVSAEEVVQCGFPSEVLLARRPPSAPSA